MIVSREEVDDDGGRIFGDRWDGMGSDIVSCVFSIQFRLKQIGL